MEKFKILSSLPAYGEYPEQFSATGIGEHQEGFVVQFCPDGRPSWVGNFQRVLSGFDHVVMHPDGISVIVISGGQAYVVDIVNRKMVNKFGGDIDGITEIKDRQRIVFSTPTTLLAVGKAGVLWESKRLSWDGVRSLAEKNGFIIGEAYDPMQDKWVPFSVDISTGAFTGGSFVGYHEK